jgi:outer membrane immunogenic protein
VKKTLLCTAAIAALAATSPALAGPPPPAPFSWTGFYAGGNIGYSWGNGSSNYSEPVFSNYGAPPSISGSQNLDGIIGGPEIGYNWQVNPVTVVGLETDFQWTGEKGGNGFGGLCWNSIVDCEGVINGTLNSNISWFGTVRARGGALITPGTFLYLTGGLAYGKINTSGSLNYTFLGEPEGGWSFGDSAIKVGGTLGGGIEAVVPFANAWTWKIEYLYIDFGSVGGSGYDNAFGGAFTWSTKVTDNIVRFGLNRRFP